MARAYSLDLRERVIAAVEAGASRHEAAETFGVSVATAVRWMQRFRATGSAAARPMGGRRGSSLEGQRAWLLARLAVVPDVTLRGLVMELAERGVTTSYGAVWRIVHASGISFKKNAVRQRARAWRCRAAAAALASLSGSA